MTSVVVCADDFAMHDQASTAIVELLAMGRISATSAMSWSPLWLEHARWVQPLRHSFDMGLHLDATSEFAHIRGGRGLGALMVASQLRSLQTLVCRDWIRSQLDAFEDVWQVPPDHVDGHQHIQQFPVIRDALIDELARRYTAMPFLRVSRPTAYRNPKAYLIQWMGAAPWEAMLNARDVPHNRWLTGLYNFDPRGGHYAQIARRCLDALPEKAVFMCHPAKGLVAGDAIGAARVREYAYFASQTFVADKERANVKVVRSGQL